MKTIKLILRIISYPFILGLILLTYNAHAIINSIYFLLYGGEWITYYKQDKITIQDIYLELKKSNKQK